MTHTFSTQELKDFVKKVNDIIESHHYLVLHTLEQLVSPLEEKLKKRVIQESCTKTITINDLFL